MSMVRSARFSRRLTPAVFTGLPNGALRSGILPLVVCVCLTLIGTEVWQLSQIHASNIEQSDIVSSNTARAMSEQAETTLQTADTIVGALVKQVEEEGTGPEALTRLHRLMTSLAVALPAIHEMGIVDSSGDAIAKSLKSNPAGLNYSDRAYFQYHATHTDHGAFIGARIQSKIDDTYSITVTRRINKPDGSFGGLAVASVSLDFFQQLFNRVQEGSGGLISLIADDNNILARAPPVAADVKESSTLGFLRQQPNDSRRPTSLYYQSHIDDVWRRGSYVHLAHFPVSTLVAQSQWDIQRSWRVELLTHGMILGCVVMVLMILGRHAMRASGALVTQATHDSLTGLLNRRAFDETIVREIRRVARNGQPLSIILIDIDHFKLYNDAFGHPAGDECLRVVARTIRSCLRRSGEFAARYGGEEFAVLLPGSTMSATLALAETMRLSLHSLGLAQASVLGGLVTISAGVATRTPGQACRGPGVLIQAADAALYAAKAAGRDTVQG